MTLTIASTKTLRNGVEMPLLGLGTYLARSGDEAANAVQWAIEAGYRHIDTAAVYRNEAAVAEGIRRSGMSRRDVFVTTKVWNTDQGYNETLRAFDRSLDALASDYVDLYLVHWPKPVLMEETWRAMELIHSEGRARAIGVSNFLVHHLEPLLDIAEVVPAVNQIEWHPHLQQPDLLQFLESRNIAVTAWSPLKRGRVLDMRELMAIADRYGKTPIQVTVRWMLQRGVITIPKSVKRDRIVANADVYDFELAAGDVAVINGLDRNERTGPHPDVFP